MNFKISLALLLGSAAAHGATPAFIEGAVSGGGGKAVVCRDAAGGVFSVELLDLWEARTLYGYAPTPVNGELATAVSELIERLKNSYPFTGTVMNNDGKTYQGQEAFAMILKLNADKFLFPSQEVLPLRGVTLTLTDDSYELARPTACQIEQVVNYQTHGRVLVNQDLFDRLDRTNQAALIAHETYYATLRSLDDESNSIRTRRAVGYVLGGHSFDATNPEVAGEHLVCRSHEAPYPKNWVEIYRRGIPSNDTQMLRIYPLRAGGTSLIGARPTIDESTSAKIADEIFQETCTDSFGMSLEYLPNGPVEFDHEVELSWLCDHGKLSAYVKQTMPGTSEATRVEMSCEKQ